jgi:hypothetical protein
MAKWRKRLFRGLTAALVLGLAGAGWLAYQVTHGPALRQQVIAQLRKHFAGAEVALGSARWRLLGGITVDNLTLYRRDDPSRTPILHVPSGVIFHDKEQLAQGRLAIRKLKLVRPRLNVSRSADGRWNLARILGEMRPDVPIPIIEAEQATVVIEVAAAGPAPAPPFRLELRHINLTALNHPLPVLTIQASGDAATYGPLHLNASWQRVHGQLAAAIDLAPVAVSPALVRELGRFAPDLAEPVRQLAGTGRLHVELQYRPEATPAWGHQVRVELAQGRLVHRDIPFTLDNLDLAARCEDGVLAIDRLSATAGPAAIRLKARLARDLQTLRDLSPAQAAPATPHPAALLPACLGPLRTLELTVERLPVTPELFARLPAAFQKYQHDFAPAGPLDLTCRLERTARGWGLRVHLRPDGMTGRFHAFPYPVQQVRGGLELTMGNDRPPQLDVDLTAETSGRGPVTIRGHVEGDVPSYTYDIAGTGIPIDEPLLLALPAKFQNQVRAFHPSGRCDVTAHIAHPAGAAMPQQHYTVRLYDTAVCYDVFPYPLEGLTGTLDFRLGPGTPADPRADTGFTFRDVRAGHAGGRVVINGSVQPQEAGNLVRLNLRGEQVALDDTLALAFARMRLRTVWDMFAPQGRFNFTADVARLERADGTADYDIRVTPAGATVRPTFFPYTLNDLTGTFRLAPGRVLLEPFTARHGPTRFDLGGGAVQFGEGGYHADLRALRAEPLPVDADFVRALPAALQAVFHALQPTGTLAVQVARLDIVEPPNPPGPHQPPVIQWDGSVAFADGALRTGVQWDNVSGVVACRGRYRGEVVEGVEGNIQLERATVFGQPLTNLHAHVLIEPPLPHVLQLLDFKGQLFGGQLGGEARVAFGAGLEYQLDLKAIGVRLEEVGRHNRLGGNAHLSGLARAELYLKGTGNGLDELEGRGNVHVPSGQMYNLPLLVDLLLKLPTLHPPDGTAFEEAHAEFAIQGRQVQVQRLDLLGSAVSLGGKGRMNLDGTGLALDCYAVWGHIVQVLPPGLRELPAWLSKNLVLLRASGQVGGPYAISLEPVPGLVEPVRQLVERARSRMKNNGPWPVSSGPEKPVFRLTNH